jgi:N-acetylglucosaminyl-diphospho-decaprenol L-rhamnosyltransferase
LARLATASNSLRAVTRSDQPMPFDLAVITVTYGGGHAPLRWADALSAAWRQLHADAGSLRAIVVDNASPCGVAERVQRHAPWVEVLPQSRNHGFAAACNIGIRHAGSARLIVLLNPDVTVAEDFFLNLREMNWENDIAAVGPQVIGADGKVEQSARRFPSAATALFGRTTLVSRLFPSSPATRSQLKARPESGSLDVDWVSGACLIAPTERFQEVGLLDESYFMYWEDADWCRRAHNRNYRVRYQPELTVNHTQGSCSAARPYMTTVAFHRSALRYYRLHAARSPLSVAGAAVALGARCAAKLAAEAMRRSAFAVASTGRTNQ